MKRFLLCWIRRVLLVVLLPVILFYACTLSYVYDHMDGNAVLPADCGLVFGTAVWPVYNASGEITTSAAGPGIERRVTAAVDLVKKGSLHRLILSGGKGEGNQKSEAEVMRDVAIAQGILRGDITVEDRSRSTWENLHYSRPLTSGCSSVVAISDGYHLARIALHAHMQEFALTTYPAEARPSELFLLKSSLREAVGIDLLVFSSLSR